MSVTVAIAQVQGRPFEPEDNRDMTCAVAVEAFRSGANIVLFPELIVPGYVTDVARQEEVAEPVDGPTVGAWQAIAKAHDGYISGGFCERDGDRLFNTAVLVGPDGVVLHYRKLHPFDLEKGVFAPGDLGLPVAHTAFGKVGLCVCYDLRFVEVVRALALQGADLVLVPTAWVAGFDRHQWDGEGYCPQARGAALQANLSQVFIACASQWGAQEDLEFLGSSLVVDPYGKAVVGPLSGTESATKMVDLDLGDARRAQYRSDRIKPREDRRTDVYRLLVGGQAL